MKFSDTFVQLLYPYLVADMAINATTTKYVFCFFVVYTVYVHTARDVSGPILELFANTACLIN